MLMEAVVRRFTGLRSGKSPVDARLTHQESLAVAIVEPNGFEMTRAARRFSLSWNGSAPTGIAPVQAFPTTAAQWAVFNADPSRTYFFSKLGAFPISGTPGIGGVLLATIFQLPSQAGLAQATGIAVQNMSNGGLSSKAVIKSAVTITNPAVPLWTPVAFNQPGAVGAGVAGNTIITPDDDVHIAIQPGYGLGLAVLALAGTTPLFLPVAEWVEQETDME